MSRRRSIPFLQVGGTHREVGRRIGEACADVMRGWVEFDADIPAGRTRADQLALAGEYRKVTAAALPWVIEEQEAAAQAAGIDPLALFAVVTEEIWYEPRQPAGRTIGRCSDLVAAPPTTASGHLLAAHNNDMPPSYEEELVAIEWHVPGDPVVFSIGNGILMSVGFNSVGLSLTGNELSPNDERVGIPREIQVRDMLRKQSLEEAVAAALRPDRASSYNNVLCHRDGRVVNVEGSATDAELTGLSEAGTLVHTNHYVCDRMLRYEGDPEYAKHSEVRRRRARELLVAEPPGSITEEKLRAMLSDHENEPDPLCRHPERYGGELKTTFWCVADVTEGRITYGRGNPCNSQAQHYGFA